MSTCKGAPPPHLDCPHGARCDWEDPAPLKRALAEAVARAKGPVPNRADRRRAARAKRR